MTTPKPGFKTTEFLVVILTAIGLIASSAADWLPSKYAALGSAIAAGAYAIARGLAKSGTPTVPSVPPAPPAAQ